MTAWRAEYPVRGAPPGGGPGFDAKDYSGVDVCDHRRFRSAGDYDSLTAVSSRSWGFMDELIMQIHAVRAQLDALEAGLASVPRPESLAWLELDPAGAVLRASPLALKRLEADADMAAGTPLGMIADVKGDPLVDGLLVLATTAGPVTALSLADGDGRTIVLGAVGGDPVDTAPAPLPRKFVHDMSNVIGVMRGRAELTAMQRGDDAVRRSMIEIQKAADRAMAMLDEYFPPRGLG